MNVEDAKRKFDQLVIGFEKIRENDLSETDTRSKVIDRILYCLGWHDNDLSIRREGHNKDVLLFYRTKNKI